MHVPKARNGWGQFEVTTEATEARLVREALHYQMDIFLERLTRCGFTDVQPLALAAFLAAHVDEHEGRCRRATSYDVAVV